MKILTISQVMNGFRIVEHVEDISEPTREWVYPTKGGMQAFVDDFFGAPINPPKKEKYLAPYSVDRAITEATQALKELKAETEAMGSYSGAKPTHVFAKTAQYNGITLYPAEEMQAIRSQADAANLENAPKDISDITASLIKRQGL